MRAALDEAPELPERPMTRAGVDMPNRRHVDLDKLES